MDYVIECTVLFREQYERHFGHTFSSIRPALLQYAKKMLDHDHEAEDAVTEVFIKAWDNRDKMNDLRHLISFLHYCLRNHCLDVLRLRRRNHKRYKALSYLNLPNIQEPINADEEIQIRHMCKTVGMLSKQEQMVINFWIFERLTNQEIGNKLFISVNTVKTHKSRAMKKLRSANRRSSL